MALGFCIGMWCVTNASADNQGLSDQVQSALDEFRQRYGFPGATVAYVLKDGTTQSVATGWADRTRKLPMKPDSRMLSASIGKSITALVTLRLVQQESLRIDDKVSRWLGKRTWFHRLPNHDDITIQHLLHHSAGIADHVHTEQFAKAMASRWQAKDNPFTPEQLVDFVLDKPALFPAGEGWAYTDTGYILLGMVIETASGKTFYELAQDELIEPLALTHTSPANQRSLPGLATGYLSPDTPFGIPDITTSEPGVLLWNPSFEWTGGGWISTSSDLARWGKLVFEDRALPDSYLDALLKSVAISSDSPEYRYGAGVGIYTEGPHGVVYGHGGWIPGYSSSLRYYADHDVAIAFQINTDIGIVDDSTELFRELEERLAALLTDRRN
jgi:D-alanyl-D-alanine carboxypeptidase